MGPWRCCKHEVLVTQHLASGVQHESGSVQVEFGAIGLRTSQPRPKPTFFRPGACLSQRNVAAFCRDAAMRSVSLMRLF